MRRFWGEITWRHIALFFAMLLVFLLSMPVGFYFAVKGGVFGKLPDDEELLHLKNYKASEVYTADGVLLGRYFVENRTECKYQELDSLIFQLLIATEDARFYEHEGVDNKSLMRVLFKSIILRKNAGGGSTLSQQLIKNIYGRNVRGKFSMAVSKVKEAILANKLEHLYSKEEVLMLYLNTVSFGEDTYGIDAASQRFFSCKAKNLKPQEAAVLVGMLKAPTSYNPRLHAERSKQRRNVVFSQAMKNGYLTQVEKDRLSSLPLEIKYSRKSEEEGLATYFREYVRRYADEYLKNYKDEDGKTYNLYTDGLKIITTLDSRLQQYAEEAVIQHLQKLQQDLNEEMLRTKWFDKHKLLVQSNLKKTNAYRELVKKGLSEQAVLKQLEEKKTMQLFFHAGEKTKEISVKDSLKHYLSLLQAGFLVEKPTTGEVFAWVGGPSYKYFKYDHVLSKRQVGSVFKPVVYAKALQKGTSVCDYIPNQKVIYSQYNDWTPKNAGDDYEGKYSVLGALTHSVNTVSVRLCMESGIEQVSALAYDLGVEDSLPQFPSVALGVGNISLREMIGVYTAFANEGVHSPVAVIKHILNENGKELYHAPEVQKKVLSEKVAQDITLMLQSVVDNGTAARLRSAYGITQGVAGKTGTTQSHTDGWFIGYTPALLAGVWVGADNPAVHFQTIKNGQGANMALPIWALFYKKVLADADLPNYYKIGWDRLEELPCDIHRDDRFIEKIFRKKEKKSHKTGLNGSRQSKGMRGVFKKKK